MNAKVPSLSILSVVSSLLGAGAIVLMAGAFTTLGSREAAATAAFAGQTGKPCGFCHAKPPALNAQGKKFKAKGNKL